MLVLLSCADRHVFDDFSLVLQGLVLIVFEYHLFDEMFLPLK